MGPRTLPSGATRLKTGAAWTMFPLKGIPMVIAAVPLSVRVAAAPATPEPNSVRAKSLSLSSNRRERSRLRPPCNESASTPDEIRLTSW